MGSCFSKAKPKNQNSKANSNSNSKGTDLFFSEQINPSPFCEAKPKNPHLHNFKIDNASLELLRHQPDAFFGVFGLAMSPGHSRPANNKCSVTLLRADTSTTMKIDILDQGTDWYLPYEDNKALCIDVPKNQPNGTLVLTHPMNGCALCVYETEDGKNNRFFHDADGKALKKLGLPPGTDSKIKYRLEEPGYAGANRPLEDARKKVDEEEKDKKEPEYPLSTVLFEHTIISIKLDDRWFVYNTALITGYANDDAGDPVKIFIRVNDSIESKMSSFPD